MSAITNDLRAQETDEGYSDLERGIKTRLEVKETLLFTTDADPASLWHGYLNSITSNRQHYNCRCCRTFIERFGGLVTINNAGEQQSAVWPEKIPIFFTASVQNVRHQVRRSRVNGVFLSSDATFGTAKSPKGWTHLHAMNLSVFKNTLLTADQRMAEVKEDFSLVQRSIEEYPLALASIALQILKSEQFPGHEKALGIAEWYFGILSRIANNRMRENIVWLAVATAPPGFAHLKNGMLGTLLDDIREGKGFDACKDAWIKKMHPLKYRRPTAILSEGQIENAEKVVEKLGIARSLERRFAKLEDVSTVIWTPKPDASLPITEGIFASLRKPDPIPTSITLPNQQMTWRKFQRDIFPNMRRLEIYCHIRAKYMGLTTATHMDAPPILQWDFPEKRNPISNYVYVQPSPASYWNLTSGWNEVTAMYDAPHKEDFEHHATFIGFAIRNCRDTRVAGLALFPSTLKAELKGIERVIEKFSNAGQITGVLEGNMNGLSFGKGDSTPVQLRVNGAAIFTLDRWE